MLTTCLALSGLLVVEAAVAGLTAVEAGATVPRGIVAEPAAGDDATAAILRARLEDKRVEVVGERTETRTVWANPDGTLTEEQAAGPVRFRGDDGEWTPVDIGLAKLTDGRVGAKAHPLGLTLAGATPERKDAAATRRLRAAEAVPAATPLVSLTTQKGQRVELGWRGALPVPRVDGTKATYRDALPHADLVVDATRTGFEQSVVLNSPKAVDEAGTLRMTLTAKGLTAKAESGGGVSFTDAAGRAAGTLPAPVMWDARYDERSGEHTHRAPVAMTVAQDGDRVDLTLTPDAAFLADEKTKFPVTVDPSVNLLTTFTTFVQEGYNTDQSAAKELKLGNNGAGQVARSFLKFDNKPVKGREIKSATLKLWNHHSWSCKAAAWEVWDTSAASTASRWSAQPTWHRKWATSTQTKGGTGCAEGWVSADIKSLAQAWAANPHDENTLGLRAQDEKDSYAWKRFASRNAAGHVPVLSVTYNNPPGTPSAVTLAPSAYNSYNKRTYATSLTPTLSAKVADPDGGTVKAQFEVSADPAFNDAGTYSWTGTSAGVASGGIAKLTIPADKKLGSFGYRVRSRAHDGSAYGAWSGYVRFRVNVGKPATPAVRCEGFTAEQWTDRPAGEIECTFSTASTDGRGFLWGLDDAQTPQAVNDPAGTGGKPQTVKVKAAKGWHTLHARTVDSAGLLSGTAAFQFGVGAKPSVLPVPDVPGALQEGATDTATPMLSGVLTSASQERVHGEFALYDAAGEAMTDVPLVPADADSGSRVATVIPEDTLTAGATYRWAMRACGDEACSKWTEKRSFTAKAPKDAPEPATRTVEISGSALSDASAPVGAKDCDGAACAAVKDELLRVGTPDSTAWRAWFKADLSAVPSGARITDARLELHRADCPADADAADAADAADGCEEPAATARDLAEPWSPEQDGQALAAAASDEAFEADDELPAAIGDLNIAPLVDGWLSPDDNHGLSLQLGDEKSAAPGVVYHSSRATDPAKRPKLVIRYIAASAPGAPTSVRAVPGDGGLLVTWNAPADPGAANDPAEASDTADDAPGALRYTVVVRKGDTEVARTTTEDTRLVVPDLTNGAEHTVTLTATTKYGTSPAATSPATKPVAVADEAKYTQAVRDYATARAGILKGTYTTAEKAAAASPHGAMFRDLLTEQEPELNRRREGYARHDQHYSSITSKLDDPLTGPGPDGSVVVRGRFTEQSVLTHKDGTEEQEEGELAGRFVFTRGVLHMEADDAGVEVTLPTTADAAKSATVAPLAEDSIEEVTEGEQEAPLVELDADGMLPGESAPTAGSPMLRAAAPKGSGTASWAKRHVGIKWEYGQDCTNFVSKALHHGGKMKQRKGGRKNLSRWFRNNIGWKRLDSYTWAGAANLRQHLKNHRGGREISRYDVRPGDVIFAYYKKDRQWNHAGVVTGGSRGKISITQHGSKNHTTLSQWLKPKKITAVSIIRPGRRS
ncbi:DNRLRE domain-containing protein [Streptomyces flavofungini]|uniref:DNRLRE domain-containing protein n=1 Tax=Streptomyces flavofungini TaxID=68200 RepID=UPI0034DF093A